ncbi:MAG: PAS domain S-box protein [Nitrospirae bacterium]|nr:PAS domain S-box protein [Nitrospirota bacterium]
MKQNSIIIPADDPQTLGKIFESLNIAIFIVSPEGNITYANVFTFNMLGYEEGELYATSLENIIAIKDMFSQKAWIKYLTKKGMVKNIERYCISKTNKRIPVLFSSTIISGNISVEPSLLCAVQDISERKYYEEQLSKAQKYAQSLIDSSMDMILAADKNGMITEFNRAAQGRFGYELEHVMFQNFIILFDDTTVGVEIYEEVKIKGEISKECICRCSDKSIFPASLSLSVLRDITGSISGFVGVLRDISERKQLEDQLKQHHLHLETLVEKRTAELAAVNEMLRSEINDRKLAEEKVNVSLREKEVLLKEIHHRVKNNLQIVSSLLNSQSRFVKDKDVLNMFKDSQHRISSMALIHEKLYSSETLSNIDFSAYVSEIADNLLFSYNMDSSDIKMKINIKDVFLDINEAIPCGLIINEIISNSIKYAFPDNRKGIISVDFNKTPKGYILYIGDNGIGLPKDIDFSKTKSLGLHLINILSTKQLDGQIEIERTNGTMFKITF